MHGALRFQFFRGAALACVAAFGLAASAAPLRYGVDETEVIWLDSKHPDLAAMLKEGEALLAKSPSRADVQRAATLFGEASDAQPQSAFLARRHCQALSALGAKDKALAACKRATNNNTNSALVMRAMVGAMMSGPDAPTPAEVGNALMLAQRVAKLMKDEPWGAAAECEVAAKLGDTEMLTRCVTTLKTLAPEHYETRRFAALLEQSRPGWKTFLGLVALAAAMVVTALHALAKKTRGAPAVAAVALVGASLSVPGLARADEEPAAEVPAAERPHEADTNDAVAAKENRRAGALSSKYPIDPANPEASVPTPEQRDNDPLEYGYYLMDLGDMAEKAKAGGDHLRAAMVYRAMAKAVPDVPVAFVKACEEYELAKDLAKAAEFCAAAITLKGVTLADYSHYARVALAKKGPVAPSDAANLDLVVKHLKDDPKTRSVGLDIQCTLGARLGDEKRLAACTPELAEAAPGSFKATFFEWSLAINQKNFGAAEKLLARARSAAAKGEGAAVDKERLVLMEKATFEAMPTWRKGFRDWRVGAGATVLLFAGLGLLLLRRRPGAPGVSGPPQQVSP